VPFNIKIISVDRYCCVTMETVTH